jgi:hypothetical protein
VTFANTTTSLAESASTTSAVRVADIAYTDDALGSETITLTGADAGVFEVFNGNQLRLRAGTALNFETKTSYTVTVNVDDPTLGAGVDASSVFTLTITDVNEAPSGVTFANTTTSLAESASTTSAVRVADIAYTDDALGNETITLTGADAGVFEVFNGNQLRLRAGTALNFETKTNYTVTVNVDDPTLGAGVDASSVFTLTITDVNEAPTAVALVNRSTAVSANLDTSSPVKVAELSVTDDALGSETITLTGPDASLFEVDPAGTHLRLKAGTPLRQLADSGMTAFSVTVQVSDTSVVGSAVLTDSLMLMLSDLNQAPVIDASGVPYYIAGVGSGLDSAPDLINGILVTDFLARGAAGSTFSDANVGALRGIAITAVDKTYGRWQYATAPNPTDADWTDIDAAGAVSASGALLLKADATTRVRLKSTLKPHHEGTVAQGFIPLESKLAAGLTFRAWDQTMGTALQRANTSINGGATAFSTATEDLATFFEARLWRSFNNNLSLQGTDPATVPSQRAQLNVYTLEAEFESLVATQHYEDRSTSAHTGFTVFLSPLTGTPLGTAGLYRLYYGVQFNDNGTLDNLTDDTETDMGYRYLTSSPGEASLLEGMRPERKAPLPALPARQGAYFRELGVNAGSAIVGYIHTTQQPGTLEMKQVYRTDSVGKPTRPRGTQEGSIPELLRQQEQGDHVYTTNTAFETSRPGAWRVEAVRGYVRELSPGLTASSAVAPTSLFQPTAESSTSDDIVAPRPTPPLFEGLQPSSPRAPETRWETLVANPTRSMAHGLDRNAAEELPSKPATAVEAEDENPVPSIAAFDDLFTDGAMIADLILLG